MMFTQHDLVCKMLNEMKILVCSDSMAVKEYGKKKTVTRICLLCSLMKKNCSADDRSSVTELQSIRTQSLEKLFGKTLQKKIILVL